MCENDLLTYVTKSYKRIENKYFNNLVLFYGLLKKGGTLKRFPCI